jgi:hypothetical protein
LFICVSLLASHISLDFICFVISLGSITVYWSLLVGLFI